jgi:hypothetical protein
VREALIILAIGGLVVAAIAWLFGPATVAVHIREGVRRGVGRLGALGGTAGEPGPVARWVAMHASLLRVAAGALGFVLLLAWDTPGLGALLFIVLLVAGLFLLIGATERSARGGPDAGGPDTGGPAPEPSEPAVPGAV